MANKQEDNRPLYMQQAEAAGAGADKWSRQDIKRAAATYPPTGERTAPDSTYRMQNPNRRRGWNPFSNWFRRKGK